MTDDQRALAEYVAKWAGEDALNPPLRLWADRESALKSILTDDALAFRALVEVILSAPTLPMFSPELDESWSVVRSDPDSKFENALLTLGVGPTPHEAIFRAHRAVREDK